MPRPYDCDWARELCYIKNNPDHSDTPIQTCDNIVQGIVIHVEFPQCWDNVSNSYAGTSQDSSAHYFYGHNMGQTTAYCSSGLSMPSVSLRYHTHGC